jgi:hypothetical protein
MNTVGETARKVLCTKTRPKSFRAVFVTVFVTVLRCSFRDSFRDSFRVSFRGSFRDSFRGSFRDSFRDHFRAQLLVQSRVAMANGHGKQTHSQPTAAGPQGPELLQARQLLPTSQLSCHLRELFGLYI